MSQASLTVGNVTHTAYRAADNARAAALASCFSGATEPAAPVAFMFWLDTSVTPNLLRQRNAGNSAWGPVLMQFATSATPETDLLLPVNRALLTEILGAQATAAYQQFDVSGTWAKPSGFSDDDIVHVELWAGGGGGGLSGGQGQGGGGGGYKFGRFRLGDLPASVAVAIGAGGPGGNPAGANGGNTTFGSLLTAYGGQNGHATSPANSGRGGGPFGIGGGTGDFWDGGNGASTGASGGSSGYGGGGGGSPIAPSIGGKSIHGGTGGTAVGGAGAIPGGGGGPNGAGARGRARVWI